MLLFVLKLLRKRKDYCKKQEIFDFLICFSDNSFWLFPLKTFALHIDAQLWILMMKIGNQVIWMSNIHEDCENYSPKKDYCLKFFEENVSEKYKVCKEYSEFSDKELSRKWSNWIYLSKLKNDNVCLSLWTKM